jgi:hypothetical protein
MPIPLDAEAPVCCSKGCRTRASNSGFLAVTWPVAGTPYWYAGGLYWGSGGVYCGTGGLYWGGGGVYGAGGTCAAVMLAPTHATAAETQTMISLWIFILVPIRAVGTRTRVFDSHPERHARSVAFVTFWIADSTSTYRRHAATETSSVSTQRRAAKVVEWTCALDPISSSQCTDLL